MSHSNFCITSRNLIDLFMFFFLPTWSRRFKNLQSLFYPSRFSPSRIFFSFSSNWIIYILLVSAFFDIEAKRGCGRSMWYKLTIHSSSFVLQFHFFLTCSHVWPIHVHMHARAHNFRAFIIRSLWPTLMRSRYWSAIFPVCCRDHR